MKWLSSKRFAESATHSRIRKLPVEFLEASKITVVVIPEPNIPDRSGAGAGVSETIRTYNIPLNRLTGHRISASGRIICVLSARLRSPAESGGR